MKANFVNSITNKVYQEKLKIESGVPGFDAQAMHKALKSVISIFDSLRNFDDELDITMDPLLDVQKTMSLRERVVDNLAMNPVGENSKNLEELITTVHELQLQMKKKT